MANQFFQRLKIEFLHPKHWGFWLALGIFRLILLLPYPILCKIGNGLGWLFAKTGVGKRRAKIAKRNLELCFPDWSEQHIHQILHANLRATGMAIIETGMAWFWSDRRIKKWSKIEGVEYLKDNLADGIIFVGVHFLTLELALALSVFINRGLGFIALTTIHYLIGFKHKGDYVPINRCWIVKISVA